jgi:hypothetical protein
LGLPDSLIFLDLFSTVIDLPACGTLFLRTGTSHVPILDVHATLRVETCGSKA